MNYIKSKIQTFQTVFILASMIGTAGILAANTQDISFGASQNVSSVAATSSALQIITPAAHSFIPTRLTLKAQVNTLPNNTYNMFWYVDNGAWNWMGNTVDSVNTKTADIDVASWNWHKPSDKYTVQVVAVIHSTGEKIYNSVPIVVSSDITGNSVASRPKTADNVMTSAPVASSKVTATQPINTSTTEPAPTMKQLPQNIANLFVNPSSNAAQSAASTTNPVTKRVMTRLAGTPTATWFGNWNANVRTDVDTLVGAAASKGQIPVLVAYNIPNRDCGSYSAGGAANTTGYQEWVREFATGIAARPAIVILEPDALPQIDCLSAADQSSRYQMLNYAVATLKNNAGTKVYIDGGHSNWKSAGEIARRLNLAGIGKSDGFSLNVSNFIASPELKAYGKLVSSATAGKHFVIDTSRNGNGTSGEWCNPAGRALGAVPTSQTGDSLIDYLLWIKTPGESDGACNGAPNAGVWWPSYVETLALNAGW